MMTSKDFYANNKQIELLRVVSRPKENPGKHIAMVKIRLHNFFDFWMKVFRKDDGSMYLKMLAVKPGHDFEEAITINWEIFWKELYKEIMPQLEESYTHASEKQAAIAELNGNVDGYN